VYGILEYITPSPDGRGVMLELLRACFLLTGIQSVNNSDLTNGLD
jgi:hypothetical protein